MEDTASERFIELRDEAEALEKRLANSGVCFLAHKIVKLEAERLTLAMLAGDEPQFYSPLAAWKAKKLRDEIITEHEATQITQQEPRSW